MDQRAGGGSVGNISHIAGWARPVGGVGGRLTGGSDATDKMTAGVDGRGTAWVAG